MMSLNPQARELVWLPVRNENCRLCPLHREAQSVCLLGDGPVPSRIMVVGEAPGYREDQIARPFSGPAGRYLDRILEEVGLPRESLYITNAVRCRPPDNATPTPGQIKACSPYMRSELEIVRPDFVLLLGNSALKAITGESGVMKKRGTARELAGGRTAFVTVHPAAVLRNPGLASDFKSDLLTFARLTRGEERHPETKSTLIVTSKALAKFTEMLAEVDTPISFDMESTSDDPNEEDGGFHYWSPNSRMTVAGFGWVPGQSYVVGLEHPEALARWDIPIERVYEALNVALEGKKIVGHNVKFDASWMKTRGVGTYLHFDTKLAAHLLDENRPQGLKPLARSYLGAGNWEEGVKYNGPLKPLAIYNGKDVDYTLRLYHIFRDELRKQPRLARLFMTVIMPACREFVNFEANGFYVDMERLIKRHKSILRKIGQVEDELYAMVPKKLKEEREVNFRSPQFLGRWLFGYLKLPIIETTPKGQPSTREAVLLELQDRSPAVAKIMELRKWQKNESTYTRNWLVRTRITNQPRLYTSYNISGTVTGRLSSNMQQVPRDVYIRSIIGAPPGWKFVEADFAQIELRLAAVLSGDRVLTKAFNNGQDPHMEMAVKILGKPPKDISKEERKLAKSVNFGFLYGMGWRKFIDYAKEKYQIEVTEEEARAYRKAFFAQYPALEPWHQRQRRIVRNTGQVTSKVGRIRHLPTINSTDEGVQAEAEREAINSPVQGLASDLTVLAMVRLAKRLDGEKSRIIGNVHDSILVEARDDYAEEASAVIKRTMEQLPLKKLFDFEPTVPIEADVTIGQYWGEH